MGFQLLILLAAREAAAGTSEVDATMTNGDDMGNSCTQDFCAHYNSLDEAECDIELALASAKEGYYNCSMVFVQGDCGTQPNTGCRVQTSPSDCWIECEDYGVSSDLEWWGLTGQELGQALLEAGGYSLIDWRQKCESANVSVTQRENFCRDMKRSGYKECHLSSCWSKSLVGGQAWDNWCYEMRNGPPGPACP